MGYGKAAWVLATDGLFTLTVYLWRSYLLLRRSCRAALPLARPKGTKTLPGVPPGDPLSANQRRQKISRSEDFLLCCAFCHFPTWGIKHRPKWGLFIFRTPYRPQNWYSYRHSPYYPLTLREDLKQKQNLLYAKLTILNCTNKKLV